MPLPQMTERGRHIKRGKRKVGEDNVEVVGEMGEIVRFAVDPGPFPFETIAPQLRHDQIGIVSAVLEEKRAKGARHRCYITLSAVCQGFL